MSPQSHCPRHTNRVHRGALVLLMTTTCLSAHAGGAVARPLGSLYVDRQEPRSGLAGANGRDLRTLAPDVLNVRPSTPVVGASRRPPLDEQRSLAFTPRFAAAPASAHGEDDSGTRSAQGLALRWQDRPELGTQRAQLSAPWRSARALLAVQPCGRRDRCEQARYRRRLPHADAVAVMRVPIVPLKPTPRTSRNSLRTRRAVPLSKNTELTALPIRRSDFTPRVVATANPREGVRYG